MPEMAETRPVFWKLQATQMSIDLDLEEEAKESEEAEEAEEKQPAPRSLAWVGMSIHICAAMKLTCFDPCGRILFEV